jgi:PRTRC genetic system protein C
MLQASPLKREFSYLGLKLADPNSKMTVGEVRSFYSGQYRDLATATITGPEAVGDKLLYRLVASIGTKGWGLMRPDSKVRREKAKQVVLAELTRRSEDRHARNQTLLARSIRCQDLQVAVLSVAHAIEAERPACSATPLAPPP